jgi:hypothetical protein
MPADHGLLGVALAPVGHLLTFAQHGDALDDLLHHALGHLRGARGLRLLDERRDGIELVVVLLVGDQLRGERLRQLRAVAIERVGLQPELPGTVASFGMLMVFEIAPEMNGCAAAIMRMWLSTER